MSDPSTSEHDEERERLRDMSHRATLLYWNSDASVNSIADDLGLSKGRLYELIRPLGAGRFCADCQSELVFENRTARDRDEPVCLVCAEAAEARVPIFPPTVDARGGAGGSGHELRPRGDRVAEVEPTGVLAGLLIGTVAGVLIARFFRR